MNKSGSIPLWSLGIAIACGIIAIAYFLVPNFSLDPTLRIAPQNIRVLDAGPYVQVRRPSVNDTEIYLEKQFFNRQSAPRQFSYTFDPREMPEDLAIFVPIIGGNASVSVNGAPFARSDLQTFPAFGFGAASIYTEMNSRYFHPGPNRLDILLAKDSYRVGLRSLYMGKIADVKAIESKYASWIVTLRKTGMLNGLIGLICASLGMLLGGHRWTMLGGLILSSLIILQSTELFNLPALTHPVLSPCLIFFATCLILGGVQRKKPRNVSLVAGCSIAAIIGALIGLGAVLTPFHWKQPITFSSMGLLSLYPALFVGLPLILSSDVVSFRQQARLAQEDARKKDQIISQKDKALRKEIEQKAVMEERQRFTRDMHDGIGGQLLSLLVRVRSGRVGLDGIENEIQSGINDLRLVVDSLDHVGDDLSSALITFENRARAQFEAKGIKFTWEQSDSLNAKNFGTRRILNLYRFLQEAVSNTLRHADAAKANIKILTDTHPGILTITIEDDGKGIIDVENSGAGKGLKNMKSRAGKLGGTLKIGVPNAGSGTRIELRIPTENKS